MQLLRFLVVVVSLVLLSRSARAEPPPPLVVYGGASEQFDFAPVGGLWFGGSVSLGVRWLDVLELRTDAEISFLARHDTPEHMCGEPPCLSGMRGVLTPSIGPRLRLGGSKAMPWALSPSAGFAMGAQLVYREPGAAIFDVETPPSWAFFAPGVTVSWGPFELRTRMRVPRGAVNAPTFEIAFGGYL